jgi:hypothetical protein
MVVCCSECCSDDISYLSFAPVPLYFHTPTHTNYDTFSNPNIDTLANRNFIQHALPFHTCRASDTQCKTPNASNWPTNLQPHSFCQRTHVTDVLAHRAHALGCHCTCQRRGLGNFPVARLVRCGVNHLAMHDLEVSRELPVGVNFWLAGWLFSLYRDFDDLLRYI